ncbi:Ig-like domain-containing protein, partial [Oceanospirillum linum]
YTGNVVENTAGDLTYSIPVKTDDLEADNSIDASVTATDAAGNSKTATADRDISVDTEINASITIDTIAGDDVLNAEEADKEFTSVTGTVGGDVKAGDEVTLTVNGETYTGAVTDDGNGNLTYSIPVKTDDLEADNSIDASVTATDAAGNSKTATADRDISVDTEINASITIDTIAGDDVLNAEEADKEFTSITGTVGGDVKAGDEVTLTVNGETYTGNVVENTAGDLTYSIPVKTDDLEADNSIDASVTATDAAGNSKTATADRDIALDGDGFDGRSEVQESGNDLSGNVFAEGNHFGDNPQIESFSYTDKSGTSQTANVGDTVTTLHGGELTVNGNGSWSYIPPASADHSSESDDALEGAGFDYTAKVDGGATYTASHEISVLDDAPEANNDSDSVAGEVGEITTGNVITGTGTADEVAAEKDDQGADGSQVTEVRFGDQTVTFEAGESSVQIQGDNGMLTLNQDGSYSYEVTQPTTTETVGGNNWDGVELKAFGFGTAYKDSDGKLDLDSADANVSYTSSGLGVQGSQNDMPVGSQINHDAQTGESEALAVDFGTSVTQATVTVSNHYTNDNGGAGGDEENGRWEAFDADGNLVGYGALDKDSIDYSNSHQGTAVIELPNGGSFSSLVFTATPYTDPGITDSDSSDFFIQGISYEEVNTVGDEFTYVITDSDGDTSEANLTIGITPPESEPVEKNAPEAADGAVITCEDKAYTFKVDDFNFTDADGDALHSVRIDSLPEDGVLSLNGEMVSAGQEVSARDLLDGGLVFTPDENESGRNEYNTDGEGDQQNDYASFDFSVSDGESWSSAPSGMTIDVSPVADIPELTVTGSVVTESKINVSNVMQSDAGYTVTAYDHEGVTTDISIVSGTSHDGFGVADRTDGGVNQGDSKEIGYDTISGTSESLSVRFDTDVSSTEVSFAWKHSYSYSSESGTSDGETAVISFYKDGELIETVEHNGGTDTIDGPFTFETTSGQSFDEIRFGSAGEGDDYLIHDLTFTQVEESDSEITAPAGSSVELGVSALPTDTDGSESIIELLVSNIPVGVTLTDGVNSFTATDSLSSVDVLSWDLQSLQLDIPDGFNEAGSSFDLNFSTMVEESLHGELASGESCPLTASDTASLTVNIPASAPENASPTATNDSVSLLEGSASLVLTADDFGSFADEDGDTLEAVRIDTLPDSDVGTLVFNNQVVTQGQELTLEQINSGQLQFVPVNDDTDLDSGFEFSVFDGVDWSEQSYSTDINIDAVADTPDLSLIVGEPRIVESVTEGSSSGGNGADYDPNPAVDFDYNAAAGVDVSNSTYNDFSSALEGQSNANNSDDTLIYDAIENTPWNLSGAVDKTFVVTESARNVSVNMGEY